MAVACPTEFRFQFIAVEVPRGGGAGDIAISQPCVCAHARARAPLQKCLDGALNAGNIFFARHVLQRALLLFAWAADSRMVPAWGLWGQATEHTNIAHRAVAHVTCAGPTHAQMALIQDCGDNCVLRMTIALATQGQRQSSNGIHGGAVAPTGAQNRRGTSSTGVCRVPIELNCQRLN